ncbi:PHP domain-containing protein [Heliorestis acidaminivorans]|uniref:PHP domain-containing protein n=1 Tax=Heliorestis acidaminivorans TaxID=553427 RepID=A0A6I0ETR5_9FIRM|nr:PHP domain-containing protein [Heliorestis acidaminivorans]KAB2952560.1 PHP domain-containing protein [Heliorestis acidaminivorans]
MGLIDLHTHSTASDGTLSPSDLVQKAKEKGITLLALTDHDTIDGVAEAQARGKQLGVKVIAGIELSVNYYNQEMHILGYHVNVDHPILQEELLKLRHYREIRNPLMIERLKKLGISITLEEVGEIAEGNIIGRPHIAALLVRKGIVSTTEEAFERFLAVGKAAYVKKEKLTPQAGIELLKKAGATVVLAHPIFLEKQDKASLSALLRELVSYGLGGIEAYYPEHSAEDVEKFVALAKEHNLIVTGGSDYHGSNKVDIELGRIMANGSPLPVELMKVIRESIEYV